MSCSERVGKGFLTWPCNLPERHDGPHQAVESQPSIRERQKWEQAQATLAQFQGPAQTTAQRYTENPTPVPGISDNRAQEGEPVTDPPVSYMAWDTTTGRVTKEADGRFTFTPQDDALDTYEITQSEAIAMLAPSDPLKYGNSGGKGGLEQSGLKQREGDQPLPTKNDHPDIQSMVIADIEARRQVGISRYGSALQPMNGRDMMLDAYEEAMDLCIYLKGVMVERDIRARSDYA